MSSYYVCETLIPGTIEKTDVGEFSARIKQEIQDSGINPS